jgi:hypothetical protein
MKMNLLQYLFVHLRRTYKRNLFFKKFTAMRKIYTLILVFSCMPFFMGQAATFAINANAKTFEGNLYLSSSEVEGAMAAAEDSIVPEVVNITPVFNVDNTTNTMTVVFTITYNKGVVLGDNYSIVIHQNPGPNSSEIEAVADTGLVAEGRTITVKPATVFNTTERYELILTAGSVVDSAGNWAPSFTHVFIYDQTSPQLQSVVPNLNELQDLEVVFTLMYNENVQLAPTYQIHLYHFPPGQERVLFEELNESSITIEENVVTINPVQHFEPLSTYELVITAGSLMDMAGNLAPSFTRSFSTIDTSYPSVVERSTSFSRTGGLTLRFSKPVTLNGAQATIRNQADSMIIATVPLLQEGERQFSLSYDITQFTNDSMLFVIEVDEGLIADLSGNLWPGFGEDAWVVGLPDRMAPELLTVDPNLDETVPRNGIFTFTFSEDIKLANSYTIQFRFYRDDGGTYNDTNWVVFEYMDLSSITISGNTLVLDPVKLFQVTENHNRERYQLIIASGSITDLAGNNFKFGERSSFSETFDTNSEIISVVTFAPMDGDTLDQFPPYLSIGFSQEILLSDSTAVDQTALDSLVYLNMGGQEVGFTASLINSRTVRIELDSTAVPEFGAQYTYGFLAGFIDSTGMEFPAQEATFTLRNINVTIAEVRGEGDVSPMEGETVRITGTVTAIFPGEGFFVQDANAVRSGIWVAYSETDTLAAGDGVIVVGEVDELNEVTSIVAHSLWLTDAPLAVEPLMLDFTADSVAMYESVLVQVNQGRASAANEQGAWTLYFDETTDSLFIGNRLLVYAPVENNMYNITGVVSNRGGVYRLQPRIEADVVDVTEPTSVHIPSGAEFTIYPNPFTNVVRISNYDKLSRVIIVNITGQLVVDIKYPDAEINTSRLISGVYIISLFDGKELLKTSRIVKR